MKRLTLFALILLSPVVAADVPATTPSDAGENDAEKNHAEHSGHNTHSDQLLLLLNHKIALQQLQQNYPAEVTQQHANLARQKRHLDQALPVLQSYSAITANHYPNNSLFQQSLINRAALVRDYADLVSTFYRQLLGR
ncbi:hypothetical protein [Bacterioplanoides pacificum]|uniref:Uncharacterized protein n=1 Tax=Bacterioplanoides pacificum TaxID=1171596 RepID=A0ABV7VYF1_9GAMM